MNDSTHETPRTPTAQRAAKLVAAAQRRPQAHVRRRSAPRSPISSPSASSTPPTLDEIEEALIRADLGVDDGGADRDGDRRRAATTKASTPDDVKLVLAGEVEKVLAPVAKPLEIDGAKPFVILVVGVNGSGKTTTIGKLAAKFAAEGQQGDAGRRRHLPRRRDRPAQDLGRAHRRAR